MIAVIGLGFVGLTTALGFCEKGYEVKGYDVDEAKSEGLRNLKIPFYEADLPEALQRHHGKGFTVAHSFAEAVEGADIIFYCVGTPGKEDGSADLTYLKGAIDQTLASDKLAPYPVLVVKSTVPPSTTQNEIKPFIEAKGFKIGKDLGLANNPEFLREGYAWADFVYPDRVVLGAEDEKSFEILRETYTAFNAPIHFVSYNTGEFIKYLSNTLLSNLISFANEQSMIAKTIGDIDIPSAFKILHEDARWSGEPAKMTSYVYPGCGYGGYCLPKDTEALYMQAKSKGYEAKMLADNLETNERIKSFMADEVASKVSKEETIGILGLSFKADSDDIRQTPALDIIQNLLDRGYKNIIAYDPMANEIFAKHYDVAIRYADTLEELVDEADQTVLVTAWKEFRDKAELIKSKPLHDLRYFLV